MPNNRRRGVAVLVFGVLLLTAVAQEPIEDLRVPVEFYPDGTLKTELQAGRAQVPPDGTIVARDITFRMFTPAGELDMTVQAETAVSSRERQTASSDDAVALHRRGLRISGDGFDWDGGKETLRIRRKVRVSFPSAMMKREGGFERDEP